jgi:hypothetical protein
VSLVQFPNLVQGDRARFFRYVAAGDPDQCWEWQSSKNNSGYGKFWLNGRTDLAHRVSYKLHQGPIPARLQVRHICDNPPCVNPSHLLVGSGKDNARDALDRGRYRRGSGNGRAKLTFTQVAEIREHWQRGDETQVSMARRYGVSRSAIQWVLNGRNWAGIEVAS